MRLLTRVFRTLVGGVVKRAKSAFASAEYPTPRNGAGPLRPVRRHVEITSLRSGDVEYPPATGPAVA